ncbi:beta-ketoacyl synthase N-terminal-like domain-containing protein [Nonomuraea soli]|uniref:Acyl transferase domain-containing protein n=1 Tax=Nonomuraea soli TaxID=1032476 RepID=A0A7W0HUS5_9ACTN|nr:polyketide synthase [Nonomuraea soli]MBA2896483.1 acyl transferase domain-containing protein [Nonomuraea soli]
MSELSVAVVGMAGRFPGAQDVHAFWRNLLDGADTVHDYTADELHELGIEPGSSVPAGGRLDGVAGFDAGFFGVPGEEALRMDPQQRLFLEQAWLALEDSGCDPESFDGLVGVFAGASPNRYFLFRQFDGDWNHPAGWAADYLTAQAAYRLGLTGPAMAVQTACSSSLVAVCIAAQNLLDFRCDVALAGGVSVTEPRFRHTPGGLVSPDGRCRAFDADGKGAAYGSGVAVLALKRLDDALQDGDHVYAVLRGWAVANDGAARAGFAAPGLSGQAMVVAEALAGAELAPADIGYVEAHGSGTTTGDAIEMAALSRAFGAGLPPGSIAVGSVKTNVGNLDAASGVAGLVKAVLAVRHGVVPANLHFSRPNPEIDFDTSPFFVPVKNHDLHVRRAGVSSFGLGGTNAHVIVEHFDEPERAPESGGWRLLPVSARTRSALDDALTALADFLEAVPCRLDDVEHTLAGRRAFEERAVVLCRDVPEAVAGLRALLAGLDALPGDAPAELRARATAWRAGEGDVAPAETGARRIPLPGYPFQRERYWIEVGS